MDIQETRQGAVTVLKPMGPLVQTDADQFRMRVSEVMGRSLGRFVVDASGVPYVDSRGLEALVDASEELGRAGQALRLCGTSDTVREVLDITDLGSLFEHFEDVNTGVRSFL
jgi:anti-anti-sigma factor